MEWIPIAKNRGNGLAPEDLKICELCGTLNHGKNHECFTCGWQGRFNLDATMIALAWRRLDFQHEGVRMEHVTARGTATVGDFGRPKQTNVWQRLGRRCRQLWNTFSARRHQAAQRHAVPTPQPTAPRNDV